MNVESVLGPDPIRLGFGEFTSNNSWAEAVVARECFLEAMLLIEPCTFQTLVTETGISLALDAYRQDALPFYRREPSDDVFTMMIHRSPGPLHDYVLAWKEQWHLPDHWIDVLAAETLVGQGLARDFNLVPFPRFVTVSSSAIIDAATWERSPETAPCFPMLPHLASVDSDGKPKNVWDPYSESRSERKQMLMAAFESALNTMLDQIAEPWTNGDHRSSIVKRHPEHFDWLVHYQVLGKSYGMVQKELAPSVSRQAIAKAVKETSTLVGLTLRPPGRAGAPSRHQSCSGQIERQGTDDEH